MSRKSKHDDNYIIDFNTPADDVGEDLLAEKNKEVLSSFGENIDSEKSVGRAAVAEGGNNAPSPLSSLKMKMGVLAAQDSVGTQEAESFKESPVSDKKPEETKDNPENAEKPEISLLEKLKRYTTDDTGHDVTLDEAPLYTLKSVADIIKSDGNKFIDKLSEKYDVTVDTLGKPSKDDFLLSGIDDEPDNSDVQNENAAVTPEGEAPQAEDSKPVPTPAFEKMASESKQRFEKSIFDDIIGESTEPVQSPVDESIPDISDIDNAHAVEEEGGKSISDTATIRFTPIKDEKGNTGRINVSSSTKVIDINQELTSVPDTEEPEPDTIFETTDFDLFAPKGEITDIASAKATVKRLSLKRRNGFLRTAVCALCTFILLLFLTPVLSDRVISSTASVITFCSCVLFVAILVNIDMFYDLYNLLKKRASHDSIVSLCAALAVPFCILGIRAGENIYHAILLCDIIMLFRAVVGFMRSSVMLSGARLIKSQRDKFAVSFIKDNSTAIAMAKNAIDGDVLIAAPKKADFISDYMKFSLYKKKLNGKIPIVFIVTLILAALGAAMGYFYYKTAFAAVYAACAAAMMASMPAVMFIDTLPLFSAAKRLRKGGGMIAGTFGADSIELANAAVVDTADIFPAGSIILKNFKVLSNNDIDRTLVNAAALTEEIGSPLAPIFGQIADTNTSYAKPDSDTIKYEERLGVSGWVDNELLFIGNRTLMEAHGIEVPSIEVDKKILRNGYFPVYVASAGKAIALIVIQYEVRSDIQKLLRQVTKLGITLLVKNRDPNVSEDMLCDYFGLYEDSVKVMTNVGVHMYTNAVADTGVLSAPACFCGNKLTLLRIMNCASRIRVSNNLLSVFYILASILGVWYFAFSSFAQSGGMLSGATVLLFELLATVLAFLAFLFRKP